MSSRIRGPTLIPRTLNSTPSVCICVACARLVGSPLRTSASRSGMSFRGVAYIEHGRRNPSLTTLLNLARGLQAEPSMLLAVFDSRDGDADSHCGVASHGGAPRVRSAGPLEPCHVACDVAVFQHCSADPVGREDTGQAKNPNMRSWLTREDTFAFAWGQQTTRRGEFSPWLGGRARNYEGLVASHRGRQ
jgi:DNA-binding XRE family transcriptional regulator